MTNDDLRGLTPSEREAVLFLDDLIEPSTFPVGEKEWRTIRAALSRVPVGNEVAQKSETSFGEAVAWKFEADDGQIYYTSFADKAAAWRVMGKTVTPLYAAPPSPPVAKLDAPAQVGSTKFGKGVSWESVIGRAQREYEYQQNPPTPEAIAEAKRLFAEGFPHLVDAPADDARDAALTYEIADGQLVVRIGVDTLATALQEGPEWGSEFRITDAAVFARAVLHELEHDEDEIGETPITRALTQAAERAIESAADGVEEIAALTADQQPKEVR
jgi:hypothetical protein